MLISKIKQVFNPKLIRNFSKLNQISEQYFRDGYAVIPNFFSHQQCDRLKQHTLKMIDQMPIQNEGYTFKTSESRGKSFIDSGDQIQMFFEPDVFDQDGNLKVPKHQSLNKIGHAMHDLDQEFKSFSYNSKIRDVLQALNYIKPSLVQSMYIFKSSKIGQKVDPHSDNTYLITDPLSVVGVWVAIEDANNTNGCMWGVPGSHKIPTTKFFKRDASGKQTYFDEKPGPQKLYPMEGAVCLEAPKGTVILLHGDFNHFSHDNTSGNSRHAYTMHFVETLNAKWAQDNWLQRPQMPFVDYYKQSMQN